MIRVGSAIVLDQHERDLVLQLLPHGTEVSFDIDRRLLPRERWYHGGGAGIGESILAPLIITILGAGVLIVLKSFLSSIGSELGKRFVQRIAGRQEEAKLPDQRPPIAVVCKVSLKVVAVVELSSVELLESSADRLTEKLERALLEISEDEEAVLRARFDSGAQLWVVERRKAEYSGLVYPDTDGPKFLRF